MAELDLDLRRRKRRTPGSPTRTLFRNALKPRPRNFHKGKPARSASSAARAGMTGAALLAGRAALKLGAGRVYVGLLEQRLPSISARRS